MRRVASLPVLLIMAAVASSASVATTGVRAQIKDRITSASDLPDAVKSLSLRNAARPKIELPAFNRDATPLVTEFYGPAKKEPVPAPRPSAPAGAPQKTERFTRTSSPTI
jgi:hypothetical protein